MFNSSYLTLCETDARIQVVFCTLVDAPLTFRPAGASDFLETPIRRQCLSTFEAGEVPLIELLPPSSSDDDSGKLLRRASAEGLLKGMQRRGGNGKSTWEGKSS